VFNHLTTWALDHPEQSIPAITAALALIFGGFWTALTFLQKIHSDNEEKVLERYRKLSKQITEGDDDAKAPYIAYQLDAVYSLRFYPKFYPRSIWMLKDILRRWTESDSYNEHHTNEVKDTLIYIAHRKNFIGRMLFGVFNLVWFTKLKCTVLKD